MVILSNFIKDRLSFKKYRIILIASLCVGIAMILLPNINDKEKNIEDVPSNKMVFNEPDDDKITEKKLEQILSNVFGVGEIRVFISYKSSEEKLVLKDDDGRGGQNTVKYESSSGDEPFVYKSLSPEIEGVIIVAEGGDRADVKSTISDAVSSVLEIPIHKVKVLKMK